MISAIIMLIVGFILVFVEFFVPGGVMGTAGALFLVSGLILFAVTSPSIWLTVVVIIGVLLFVGVTIKFALYRISHAKENASIFLKSDQEGYCASEYGKELVGKEGIVDADLHPAGHILVEGQRVQAVAQMGYLPKGTKIIIIGGEGAHLKVREKK